MYITSDSYIRFEKCGDLVTLYSMVIIIIWYGYIIGYKII